MTESPKRKKEKRPHVRVTKLRIFMKLLFRKVRCKKLWLLVLVNRVANAPTPPKAANIELNWWRGRKRDVEGSRLPPISPTFSATASLLFWNLQRDGKPNVKKKKKEKRPHSPHVRVTKSPHSPQHVEDIMKLWFRKVRSLVPLCCGSDVNVKKSSKFFVASSNYIQADIG